MLLFVQQTRPTDRRFVERSYKGPYPHGPSSSGADLSAVLSHTMRKFARELTCGIAAGLITFAITAFVDIKSPPIKWGLIIGALIFTSSLAWALGRDKKSNHRSQEVSIFKNGRSSSLDIEDVNIDSTPGSVSLADGARTKGAARFKNIRTGREFK